MRPLRVLLVTKFLALLIAVGSSQFQIPIEISSTTPTVNDSLTCHCDHHGRYVDPDTGSSVEIPCDNITNVCTVSGKYKACMIEVTISNRPFKIRKTCSSTAEFMALGQVGDKFSSLQVVTVWTIDGQVLVYVKCSKSDQCNFDFKKAGFRWLYRELRQVADKCLPVSPERTSQVLKINRNLTTALTCHCKRPVSCQKSRCVSQVNQSDQMAVCARRMDSSSSWSGCEVLAPKFAEMTKNYAAGYIMTIRERFEFYSCRYADECNEFMPSGIEKAVCHWTCPKLPSRLIPKFEYLVGAVIVPVIVAVGLTFLIASPFVRTVIQLGNS